MTRWRSSGVWYTATAFLFFLFGGLLALLIRIQLAVPGNTFLSAETYNQVFTVHGSVMMFLFAIPVFESIAVIFLPQMLGARDLPFPRLSAFGGLAIFIIGGLTGVMVALAPFDFQAHDTIFVVGHLHYVLIGGALFPIAAGCYYFFPLHLVLAFRGDRGRDHRRNHRRIPAGQMNASNPLAEQQQRLWLLVVSPSIWALHFLLCYLTAAIWCEKMAGPDQDLGPVRGAIWIYTILGVIAISATGWVGYKKHSFGSDGGLPHDDDTPEDRHRFLGWATLLLSGLSLVAILFEALVLGFFWNCY
jgi:hypothetical protein